MCGIIGYIGNRQAKEIIIQGLEKLEYRGYDSAGLSVLYNDNIRTYKCEGDVSTLYSFTKYKDIPGRIGIGHTRWATHGVANKINAHPHNSNDNRFSIVHNGIIDNYFQLKNYAEQKGYSFVSDTDSEVIAALLQLKFDGDVLSTIKNVSEMLSGAYAIAVISSYTPDAIYSFKSRSPLLIGKGEDEFIISSDIYAFNENINEYYILNDGEIAIISDNISIYDEYGKSVIRDTQVLSSDIITNDLRGFEHYLIKEIYEQPKVINNIIKEFNFKKSFIKLLSFDKIYIVGCGSAYNAGIICALVLEQMCGINTRTVIASEYHENLSQVSEKDVIIAISQSGETADTIAAVKYAKDKAKCKVLSIVNTEHSTLGMLSDYILYTKAGKEVSVATTKCYFAQVLMSILIANDIADEKFINLSQLNILSSRLLEVIKSDVSFCLNKIINSKIVIFLGKGIDYCTCVEASLKLKEVSYLNAEAYLSGELKHGSIALIDTGSVVVMVCTDVKYLEKNIIAVKEVRARGAYVIGIISEECAELKKYTDDFIVIPSINKYLNSLISIVPMQLIAYYSAKQLGVNIDKPRNLAKSVTVE